MKMSEQEWQNFCIKTGYKEPKPKRKIKSDPKWLYDLKEQQKQLSKNKPITCEAKKPRYLPDILFDVLQSLITIK